jgi:aminoglycoside phosphotransferase (APT) family kinase protein
MNGFDDRLSICLSRAIPGFEKLVSARRLSGGASQETYRVEIQTLEGPRTLALRRAAGGLGAGAERRGPGLAVEAELFRVARAAGVPEPEILHVCSPDDGLGAGFLMEWLDGETVGSRILRDPRLDDVRPRLAFACGEVLARIHQIDPVASGLVDRLETVSTRDFVMETWEHYQSFETALPMIDYTARWLLDHLPEEHEPRLVHNDFRNGNIMVSPDGIVAVLDWELAHLGDPVRDLGWICTNSWRFGRHELRVGGFGQLEDLLDGYESVSGIRVDEDHVRFWEVFGSFWWAATSLSMAFAWRGGVDRTVERPAVARRSSECQVDCANLIIAGPVKIVDETTPPSSVDMPSVDELLTSVRDFLREDAREALQGRDSFLALVASNSLEIVQRELTLGPAHLRNEGDRLRALFGLDASCKDSHGSLRARLCEGLRDGSIALDRPGLAEHLRTTAVNQLAIDQPKYSGLAAALAFGSSADSSQPEQESQ